MDVLTFFDKVSPLKVGMTHKIHLIINNGEIIFRKLVLLDVHRSEASAAIRKHNYLLWSSLPNHFRLAFSILYNGHWELFSYVESGRSVMLTVSVSEKMGLLVAISTLPHSFMQWNLFTYDHKIFTFVEVRFQGF